MTGAIPHAKRAGRLRRFLGRLSAPEEAASAAEEPLGSGCTPIRDCGDRQLVRVSGTLRTVTLQPRAGVPTLEAELDDGSAALDIVWLGRRAIAGVEPGRRMIVRGRIVISRGRPVLFNPKYELRPLADRSSG